MSNTYIVKKNGETLATIAKSQSIDINKLVALNPKLNKDSALKVGQTIRTEWITFRLNSPKVVAIATDKYLTPRMHFPDAGNLPGVASPMYGQDITYTLGRVAPAKQCVGNNPADLKPLMQKLVKSFGSADTSGMVQRLFSAFLAKQNAVTFFENGSLNFAASRHVNILAFCDSAMSVPGSPGSRSGKKRIHQALANAGWDINKIIVPTDLGVPAFNLGNKVLKTGDFANGLGVMVNGVQHAYAVATSYVYDESSNKYNITIKFFFYDVFGLDDDDLREFGAASNSMLSSSESIGITAWWQLQHQHAYAPLVTRVVVEKRYEVSTK